MPPQRRSGDPSRRSAGTAPGARSPRAGTAPAARPSGATTRARPPAAPVPEEAAAGLETARAARRTNLTSRAAILALVLCALALSLAYPLREFLSQRGEISDLRGRTAAQQQRVAELAAQKERWKDPAYVKAQARQRLHFVLPGETAYVVLDPTAANSTATGAAPGAPQRPWYSDLWASVNAADGGAAPAR